MHCHPPASCEAGEMVMASRDDVCLPRRPCLPLLCAQCPQQRAACHPERMRHARPLAECCRAAGARSDARVLCDELVCILALDTPHGACN